MPAMVVSVNDKLIFNQQFGQLGVTADVLTQTMSNLNNPARFVMVTPFRAGNREPITACELKSLRRAHYIYECQATARSWRAQAASRRTLLRILPEPLFGSSV